jgi:hypothetical protein
MNIISYIAVRSKAKTMQKVPANAARLANSINEIASLIAVKKATPAHGIAVKLRK